MDVDEVIKIGEGLGPAPVASVPRHPQYQRACAEEDGRGSAGDAQSSAPPPLDGMPLSGQQDPSRSGRFRGSGLRSHLSTALGALFCTVVGSVLLGLGIFGIVVGVPNAQREYEKEYAQWKVDCPEPNKGDCTGDLSSCSPTNCAPCIKGTSGTSIALGSATLIAGIAIFIALLYAHIRKVDMFSSV